MLEYVFAGLALGSIYAIASASLVVTYVSSGVMNFAFGSMAFFIARLYYALHSEQGWGILPAAVVALFVAGPLLGAFLYLTVFRHLRQRSSLIRVVVTIGVSVTLPPAAILLFNNDPIPAAPGLAPRPVKVFHVFGAPVSLDQIIVYVFMAVVLVVGTLVLRYTDVGLKVRALVDSEALTSLSGVRPARVSLAVWSISATLAGIVGVLVAPIHGLTVGGMTLLMAAAFAAVVAAQLRSLPAAVVIALLMGLVTDVIQKFLPLNSEWTNNLVPGIPFVFILLFLLVALVRTGSVSEGPTGGGAALDAAVRVAAQDSAPTSQTLSSRLPRRSPWRLAQLVPIALVCCFPFLYTDYDLFLVGQGLALAIALLSYTVVTGEGGMIWLCQITFAGGGALVTGELAANHGVATIPAALLGALAMVPLGLLIGALTIRLGDLYVALVTLSIGLLVDVLVFPRPRFFQGGLGVPIERPGFVESDRAFALLCLGVFLVLGVLVLNLRRSTAGMAMSAVRWSEPASRTMGISVIRMKLLVSAFATFIAALGGAMMAIGNEVSLTSAHNTFGGLIWMAVLVTIGVRSIAAAAFAGLAFAMMPNIFSVYLPSSTAWLELPALLFGLGAIGIAVNPDGIVAQNARRIMALIERFGRKRPQRVEPEVSAA